MTTIANISLIVILFTTFMFAQNQSTAPDAINTQNDKYVVRQIVLPDGRILEARITPSPPYPPPGFDRITAVLPSDRIEEVSMLNDVPAFNWSFGCSATSAAMIAGYYDRIAYHSMYSGPTNGGVMPLNNSAWPDWVDSNGDTRHQCPLSATRNGFDGRSTKGHVDDYWEYYNQPGPDPWVGNWTEHTHDDCTGDFMKTNQWIPAKGFNIDGSTVFYNYTDGSPLPYADMEGHGIHMEDGGYGIKLFYESRGYTVTEMFNQHILGYAHPIYGYTYDQYKAEIDAGRPVMIHVEGHTMVGIGYDDATDLMYIHDTWDYNVHIMTWGGSYSGMDQTGVTIVHLQVPDIIFTNGANPSLNFSQAPPLPPETDWPFAQFSLTSDANGATFNAVTISLSGSFTGLMGSYPFRLHAASSNDFSTAEIIGSNAAPAGETVIFSLLNDELPNGERYYWITADLSESASGTINGTIADASALDISNTTFSAASHYGILNTGEDVSLPVELSSFKAFAAGNQIILQWKTQSELNNLGFIIKRGTVPEGSYSEIASYINHEELRGKGNTPDATVYEFSDDRVENGRNYFYTLTDVDFNGKQATHGPIEVTAANVELAASEFHLDQNYPNPFNPSTKIKFALSKTENVKIEIFNTLGQRVETLANKSMNAGYHEVEFNAQNLSSGIYYYRIEAGEFQDVKKMILIK